MNIRAKIFGGASPPKSRLLKAKKPQRREAGDAAQRQGRSRGRQKSQQPRRRPPSPHRRQRPSHPRRREHDVELINLSGGGAMVSRPVRADAVGPGRSPPWRPRHDRVRVRWIRDGRIGLEFAHETRLDGRRDQVATVLREVIERSFPDIRFPEARAGAGPRPSRRSDETSRARARHPLIWNRRRSTTIIRAHRSASATSRAPAR